MASDEAMIDFARKALGLSAEIPIILSSLEGRGSDRSYHRLNWRSIESAILVHYEASRIENAYFAGIASFLAEIGVPTPRLICHDPADCLIVMEDLGATDLWRLRKDPWETRRVLYLKTLAAVRRLHSFPEKDFPSNRVMLMDAFGHGLYRWERDYFRDHFVKGICGIEGKPGFARELEVELFSLAGRLMEGKRCLIHRDLQSQNVMIRQNEPFLIDFQGMRFGNPFYDLGSLLCDPYVDFSDAQREELLSAYWKLAGWNMVQADFEVAYWEASAQRLMQALGAYGYLGRVKGLKSYLGHIPAGLANLSSAVQNANTLPCLSELLAACREAIGGRATGNPLEAPGKL
jgi:N-acetylmuramate 1-kinase